MIEKRIRAILGQAPFDYAIRNVRVVNVFNNEIKLQDIGIVGDRIAYVGTMGEHQSALQEIDGQERYALPGFIDAHMHLESSMMTPSNFAKSVIACGTTTVAADPHEIANVMGRDGVQALMDGSKGLPLNVLIFAPSTIPSLPGFEDSNYEVDGAEMNRLLNLSGIHGLGEVMDFNGVAAAEPNILRIIEAGAERGCILDGHASMLTGDRLQAFRATGIDSDHTTPTAEKLKEELALGFNVQIQEIMLSEAMVQAINEAPVQNRICLVTDDVPLTRLMYDGHLNHVVEKAIELGLDPLTAIRCATINAADRLRLNDTGAVCPGRKADIQLVRELEHPKPDMVFCGGVPVYENGAFLVEFPASQMPEAMYHTMNRKPMGEEDFRITCDVSDTFQGGKARVNMIYQDGVGVRTKRKEAWLPLQPLASGKAKVNTDGHLLMAVCNRYGKEQYGLGLVDGVGSLNGAVALTYGHDCHNLTVYGSNPADMTVAANAIIQAGGGICAVEQGQVINLIALPLAGLLCEDSADVLLNKLDDFLNNVERMGFRHARPLSFFTTMPLAVSPEIKCTDKGLLDVANKTFLPVIEEIIEEIQEEI
ncbi:MAG: adenine deaminase [Peptococcaceae bacterium]|nr:adenine deaminase [Peptococcaceae bacterium]